MKNENLHPIFNKILQTVILDGVYIDPSNEPRCNCSDGGKWLDGYYDTHCERCKKRLPK
jgi:hypothetical protein